MPALESKVDVNAESFHRNAAEMQALIDGFRAIEARIAETSARAKPRFDARGQLLPRERISRLLDRGTLFLELATLAGYRMHDDDGEANVSGGGNICGIGQVSGIRAMVIANDAAIKGGASSPMGLKKRLRAQEIAYANKLPTVYLVESAGANLLRQSELFVEGGRTFCNQARASAAGLPQVTVVHGSSTAGGAYLPGLSDYVVVVRKRAKIFLAGPPLLKAATGEVASDEELGGAEMHTAIAGTAEYMAEDDAEAIDVARQIMAKLPWDEGLAPLPAAPVATPPRYDAQELLGLVPVDYARPYDAREVIARIVDDSDFLDFKPLYGAATVTGHAQIEGQACGIIANNGPIDPQGSVKAAQFIQLCCQSNTPIVYLQNTTGYIVGREAEEQGIVKHGSKMIQAVANASVPQITILIGGSFGAGNYGMCGRAYDPRFIFAWPNARISVMGGRQAARVMSIITEERLRRDGKPVDAERLEAMEDGIVRQIDAESTAPYATAHVWDDGLIDPRDTRRVLGYTLSIAKEAERRRLSQNSFGVARG
ncbi:MAG: carboxyl transferase domain-containing protein [Alphaproteobacteria bacterium]|jgi:geranyl-CoA carboxylase beta subunit|nr:carboxyl transferase domain-containing protein [Alphaproteobacteria bacterium]